MLELKDLRVSYGNIKAVRGVSLRVEKGETVALIGANGAGKTTVLKAVSGLLASEGGDILLGGVSIVRLPADRIVSFGLRHVPEGRQVFSSLTVWENLRLGAYALRDGREIARRADEVFTLFPVLAGRRKQLAGTLSGGEQQMLAIGRGLIGKPEILLLDEPSLGLSPVLVQQVFSALESLKQQGVTMLLVEQNAFEALRLSDRAYILETGQVVHRGVSSTLACDPLVKKAYLGG